MGGLTLPFITKSAPRRKKKQISEISTKPMIKIRNQYAPMEIQGMSMPQLEYIYEHGSPTERDMADQVITARKKFEIATMMPDDILASGSQGAPGNSIAKTGR
jgi:hypothetical protein